jgi:hypothetical protein
MRGTLRAWTHEPPIWHDKYERQSYTVKETFFFFLSLVFEEETRDDEDDYTA